MTKEETDDLLAAIMLIEERHPECGFNIGKFHPEIVRRRSGRVSVQLYGDKHTTFEERQTFMNAAKIACDRLDRRNSGDASA